jgi:hypothetical protein
MRTLTFAAALLFATTAVSADGVFIGHARDLKSGRLLYTESHAISNAGTPRETRVVTYACPDGAPFARKQLAYEASRLAPTFRLEDARSGVIEGIARDARGLEVFARADAKSPLHTARVDGQGLVADAGFDEFVRASWDALERGEPVVAPFLVPSRLDSLAFKVRKTGESRIDGEVVSDIRLSLAGVLGWLVPDLDVSYRKRDRRLMRFRGTTNLRDAGGKMIEARIDFPAADWREGAVDPATLGATPLVSACRS